MVPIRDGLHWLSGAAVDAIRTGSYHPGYPANELRSGEQSTLVALGEEGVDLPQRMLRYLDAFAHEAVESLLPAHNTIPKKAEDVVYRLRWTQLYAVGYDSRCKRFLPWDTGLYSFGDLAEDIKALQGLDSLMALAVKVLLRANRRLVFVRTTDNADLAASKRASAGPLLEEALRAYQTGDIGEADRCARKATSLLSEAQELAGYNS
jgi:hypothetical protein